MIAELLRIALLTNLLVLVRNRPGIIQIVGITLYILLAAALFWRNRNTIKKTLLSPRSLAIEVLQVLRSLSVALFLTGTSGDPWLAVYSIPRMLLLITYGVLTYCIFRVKDGQFHTLANEIRSPGGSSKLLLIPIFMLYLCNSTNLITSDSRGNGLLPFSIENGRLDLDEFIGAPVVRYDKEGLEFAKNSLLVDVVARPVKSQGPVLEGGYIMHAYHVVPVNMHFYNMFPLLPGFANTLVLFGVQSMGLIPEYRPPPANSNPSPLGVVFDNSVNLLRITAALQAAAAVALLLSFLLRRLGVGPAVILAVLYAVASFHYSLSSQALWQHGLGELLAVALLCTIDPARRNQLSFYDGLLAGCLLALLVGTRPTNVVIAGCFGLYIVWTNWRILGAVVLGALPVILGIVAINLMVYEHPLGGYGHWRAELFYQAREGGTILGGNPLTGAAGLLLSPGRGLLFHMPYLIAAIVGGWKWRHDRMGLLCILVALAHLGFFVLTPFWSGGVCYGPRYLLESLPFWMLLLIPIAQGWAKIRFLTRAPILAGVVVAVFAQLSPILSERPLVDWNLNPHINLHPERLWNFRDPPMLASLKPFRTAFLDHSRFLAAFADSQRDWLENDVVRSAESESGYLRVKPSIKSEGVWIVLKMPVYLRRGSYDVEFRVRAARKGSELKLVTEGEALAPVTIPIPEHQGFQIVSCKLNVQKSGLKSFSVLARSTGPIELDYIDVKRP